MTYISLLCPKTKLVSTFIYFQATFTDTATGDVKDFFTNTLLCAACERSVKQEPLF